MNWNWIGCQYTVYNAIKKLTRPGPGQLIEIPPRKMTKEEYKFEFVEKREILSYLYYTLRQWDWLDCKPIGYQFCFTCLSLCLSLNSTRIGYLFFCLWPTTYFSYYLKERKDFRHEKNLYSFSFRVVYFKSEWREVKISTICSSVCGGGVMNKK